MKTPEDVQSRVPDIALGIEKVGIKNLKVPLTIKRPDGLKNIISTVDVFVDIPAERKGADMSRSVESVNDIVNGNRIENSIERVGLRIGEECLKRFTYSEKVEVKLKGELFIKKISHFGKESMVPYVLIAKIIIERNNKKNVTIGVEVNAMNACPCAMETARTIIEDEFPQYSEAIGKIPFITHNQRNHIILEVTSSEETGVDIYQLIDAVENVMGEPLLPVLKRMDEGMMVVAAHKKPMFVEDIVRECMREVSSIEEIPLDATIKISSESEESIHPHNAYAEITMKKIDVKKILRN